MIGIPHPALGEEVAAAEALKPDVEVTTHELRDFVKRQVAAYKSDGSCGSRRTAQRPARQVLKREIAVPTPTAS